MSAPWCPPTPCFLLIPIFLPRLTASSNISGLWPAGLQGGHGGPHPAAECLLCLRGTRHCSVASRASLEYEDKIPFFRDYNLAKKTMMRGTGNISPLSSWAKTQSSQAARSTESCSGSHWLLMSSTPIHFCVEYVPRAAVPGQSNPPSLVLCFNLRDCSASRTALVLGGRRSRQASGRARNVLRCVALTIHWPR